MTREAAGFAADAKYLVLYGDSSMYEYEVQVYLDALSRVYRNEITADAFTETVGQEIQKLRDENQY